jgi:hypothetical protein
MKYIEVQKIGESLYIHAYSSTSVSLIPDDPFFCISTDSEPSFIGEIVLETFLGSRSGLPNPTQEEWKQITKEYSRKSGLKPKDFHSGLSVSVELENNQLTFVPTKNEGKRGFTHLRERLTTEMINDTVHIATVLEEAFTLCS